MALAGRLGQVVPLPLRHAGLGEQTVVAVEVLAPDIELDGRVVVDAQLVVDRAAGDAPAVDRRPSVGGERIRRLPIQWFASGRRDLTSGIDR